MKKKLVVFITALVMVFACALGLVACGGFDDGTYVMYMLSEEDGEKVAMSTGSELEFKDEIISAGKSGMPYGTYEMDGGKLVVTAGSKSLKFSEKDNYWVASENEGGTEVTYALCKKGETPKGYTVA